MVEESGLELDIELLKPTWQGCAGIFNETNQLTSSRNEEGHYLKHVVLGREWQQLMPLSEYRELAKNRLNDIGEEVVELCQMEDHAVVKYHLNTGELGIARRDDGRIKTFFRPNDFGYVMNKIENGEWGDADTLDLFTASANIDFDDDPEKAFLFTRLTSIALELTTQADQILLDFAENDKLTSEDLLSLVSKLAECLFAGFELEQRILTEEQEEAVHELRRKVLKGEVVLEALERSNFQKVTALVEEGLKQIISLQQELWEKGDEIINEAEDLELVLAERDRIGFAVTGLKTWQMHGRLHDISLAQAELTLRKSDLHLQRMLYPLILKLNFKQSRLVSPDNFFWRKPNK